MSRRRKLRLARTVLAVIALVLLPSRMWAAWVGLEPRVQDAYALFITAGVLLVWGIAACLRERRLELARKAAES